GNTLIGAHPKISVVVFENGVDIVVRKTVGSCKCREVAAVGIKLVETVGRAYPYPAVSIFADCIDPIACYAYLRVRIINVGREFSALRIKPHQSEADRSYPDCSRSIFANGADTIAGEAVR